MNIFFKEVPSHIYIHLPFCVKRCYYCDFVSLAGHEDFIQPYHEALIKEIKLFAQTFSNSKSNPIKTIFIGGGTPSLYPVENLEDIFQVLHDHYDLGSLLEVTIEANPVDITAVKLAAWKNLGINRVSMGIQVLDDGVLKKLNRLQRVDDVLRAIEMIPNYFENISIDLILGLPGVSNDVWQTTLENITKWPITHVSNYLLTVYDNTPLYFKIKSEELSINSDEKLVSDYQNTYNFLESAGFMRYEISNFAKKGSMSLHNCAYWNRIPYCGFGLSAASFDGKNRYSNQKNLEKYIRSVTFDDKLPLEYIEKLNVEQEVLEILMLGLRVEGGVDLQSVLYLLADFQKERFLINLNRLMKERFIEQRGSKVCLGKMEMLFENGVVLNLLKEVF